MARIPSASPLRNQSGAAALEYALVASLIAVVAAAAVTLVGANLSVLYGRVAAGF